MPTLSITLKNNTRHKNKYSVFVDNGKHITESRFSHANKARKYVEDCFEKDSVKVTDEIINPIKKIKVGRWQ